MLLLRLPLLLSFALRRGQDPRKSRTLSETCGPSSLNNVGRVAVTGGADAVHNHRRRCGACGEPHRALVLGGDGPLRHQLCQNEAVENLKQRGRPWRSLLRIGMDTSKSAFQLHGVDSAEQPILQRKLRRGQALPFFGDLPPAQVRWRLVVHRIIGRESCKRWGTSSKVPMSDGTSRNFAATQSLVAIGVRRP